MLYRCKLQTALNTQSSDVKALVLDAPFPLLVCLVDQSS